MRPGLSLVQVLVAMCILGILIGLTIPAVQKVRQEADRTRCLNHLKELALALHMYHDERNVMPPYATGRGNELLGSWFVYLLPYVGHTELYDQLQADQQAAQASAGTHFRGPPVWKDVYKKVLFPGMLCPADPTRSPDSDLGRTNYLANWYALTGDNAKGAFSPPVSFHDLTDGLSNVVLFAEGYTTCHKLPRWALASSFFHNFGITQQARASDDPCYLPVDYTMFQVQPEECDRWRTQTGHPAMPTALADATVRSTPASIAHEVWKQLLKPRDGAAVEIDW